MFKAEAALSYIEQKEKDELDRDTKAWLRIAPPVNSCPATAQRFA